MKRNDVWLGQCTFGRKGLPPECQRVWLADQSVSNSVSDLSLQSIVSCLYNVPRYNVQCTMNCTASDF